MDWGQLWSFARIELGLASAEFWRLTLYELDVLRVAWRRQQEREDRRAALSAWVLVNVNRDTAKRAEPFDLQEIVSWLGHGFQRETKPAPAALPDKQATLEELMQKMQTMKMLNDAIRHNGPQGTS